MATKQPVHKMEQEFECQKHGIIIQNRRAGRGHFSAVFLVELEKTTLKFFFYTLFILLIAVYVFA